MAKETINVMFQMTKRNVTVDLEIPLNISANDLVLALNEAYHLDIDTSNIRNCYLKSENPIALLKGNKTLAEYGIRHGSIIYYTK